MGWSNVIDGARQVMSTVMNLVVTPLLVYFWIANTLLLVLTVLAIWELLHHRRRKGYAGAQETVSSQLAQGVSVVVPAFNEELVIVRSVRAGLALHYPRHEVIVVDDGSTDATFANLRKYFDLVPVPAEVPYDVPAWGRVLDVHVPRDGRTPLVVVRKEHSGRADTNNVGINAATEPLVAFLDADLILEPDALIELAKPFADDPIRVVATGGVIRVGNGCKVVDGRIGGVNLANAWLVRIQILEYLRTFLLGRCGWSRFGALFLNDSAFGMFRRDVLVEVDGYDLRSIGAEFELVLRIHQQMIATGREYSVHFVAEQVSWTEVPVTVEALRGQRRRWHQGLCETLWKHRGMLFRPRYGRVGMVALPYYWAFEVVSPLLELLALGLVATGLVLGVTSPAYALLFVTVVYGYAAVLTLVSLAVEEVIFHKYPRWRDLGGMVLSSVLESIGYRQLTAWWRLHGLWVSLRGERATRGTRTRQGFEDDSLAVAATSGDV